MKADFSGYATRSNVRCSDGRTILPNAFQHQDGEQVPLVWQHGHESPHNVLGHVTLQHVDDGVKALAYFNDTEAGKTARQLVDHGDIKFLSIFANQLVEKAKQVAHGMIKEVSLVIGGANPGATIDNVTIVHSDGDVERFSDEAQITTGLEIELAHASTATDTKSDTSEDRTLQEVLDTLNEEQSNAVNFLLSQALAVETPIKHSDTDADGDADDADSDDADDADDADSTDDANDADDSADKDDSSDDADSKDDSDEDDSKDDADSDDSDGSDTKDDADDTVQHGDTNQEVIHMNVFENTQGGATGGTLAHSQVKLGEDQVKGIIKDTIKHGSLKEAVENFVTANGVDVAGTGTLAHGIENIEYLFPDAKLLENSPAFVSRRMEWVSKVLDGVRKSPFPRIKTMTADITPDEARARGYIKGNMKNEEFFALSKRETTPQTIYKKQKLDRDDVIDIVDLDVVAWMKAEMKVMLDEELAGAILVGDGRSAGDEDKIREDKIRPIASDSELYVTTVNLNLDDPNSSAEELVDAAIMNREFFKGTGLPTFYTTESTIAKFLTAKDGFGRRLYSTLNEVATVLRVADIVPVEILNRQPDVVGIMVNLADYTLGAGRGGQATMFDDFDIDFNKLRYLIETRCSGALTMPKAAIVFRKVAGTSVLRTPVEPTFANNTVTVPTVTGVVYKDGAGNTLSNGSPVALSSGQKLTVNATPASGSYFASSENDSWTYENKA